MLPFLLFLFLESALLTFVLCWLVLRFFPRWKLLDRPERYGLKRKPIPYPGGIVLFIVFVVNILLFAPLNLKFIGLIIGLTVLTIVCFLDDRIGLPPVVRLLVQIVVATFIALTGTGISSITNPLGGPALALDAFQVTLPFLTEPVSILSVLFTVIWIVLFVNTLNWLDGIPGQVSGVSSIGFLVVFILSLTLALRTNVGTEEIVNAELVARLAIIGVAMCLTFAYFDFPPAKMIIGDSGSMPLGFIIAVLAIFSGSKVATTFLVLGFPVIDALFVIARRIAEKKSPLSGDLGHFHHRLLRIGFSEPRAVLIMYSICLTFGMLALFLPSQGKLFVILLMLLLAVTMEIVVMKKEARLKMLPEKKHISR